MKKCQTCVDYTNASVIEWNWYTVKYSMSPFHMPYINPSSCQAHVDIFHAFKNIICQMPAWGSAETVAVLYLQSTSALIKYDNSDK